MKSADQFEYQTIIELVNCYSPSGEETKAVKYLIERMKTLGFKHTFQDDAGNAVGMIGNGPRQVILLGHIDTVPGEIPIRVEDDLLYGRGSVDAKGSLAAFVDAVANVGAVEGWQLIVIGAVDEEGDSTGARFVVNQYRPDFAIIGEPSRWDRLTLGYKGSAQAEITVTCPVKHTSAQGQSAPEIAIEIWNQLNVWVDEFNAGHERAFDQLLPRLGGFSSETDHFQETATLQVGVRLPLDVTPEDWYKRVNQTSDVFETSEVSCEITFKGFPIPAYKAERNTPLVRAFLGAIRAEGGKPGFVAKTGTADLNIVAPKWGCPALAYGPGDSSLDHTPHEHISFTEYIQAVKILEHTLTRLTNL